MVSYDAVPDTRVRKSRWNPETWASKFGEAYVRHLNSGQPAHNQHLTIGRQTPNSEEYHA
jgi:hypothetical protein